MADHTAPARTLFYGTFISVPPQLETAADGSSLELSVNHGALWVAAEDGRIEGFDWSVHDEDGLQQLIADKGWETDIKVVRANAERNEFFFPGFIDTHIHAPQYPNSGIFGSSTLLDWLERYTFPLESSFGNKENPSEAPQKAHVVYNRVVSRTLSHGTTCAAYFATIHVPATNLLASICHSRGQRALIGRVCMDIPDTCPSHYRDESPAESVAATQATMEYINALDPSRSLVLPIITPRFAVSCSSDALSLLGALAASTSPPTHIQTHISENRDEIDLVLSLHKACESYAQVYDKASLLTPLTILAHGVHLTSEERQLIRDRGASISHCPASNTAIGSGLCPVRTLLDDGVNVGLGTDVSGGYSSSILEAARQACLVSRMVGCQKSNNRPTRNSRESLSVEEALYLATRGGAKSLGMQEELGGFEKGMFWDAQMISLGGNVGTDERGEADNVVNGEDRCLEHDSDSTAGPVDVFGWETWEEKVAKWVWTGDDRNVKAVWVAGRLVHSRK